MKLLDRIFSRETASADVLPWRFARFCSPTAPTAFSRVKLPGLGSILKDEGIPAGMLLGHLVCLAETGGTMLVALRLLVLPVTLILSLIYFTGIMLFQRHNGFFVVGPGSGGWEYAALLTTCLLVTAWENRARMLF